MSELLRERRARYLAKKLGLQVLKISKRTQYWECYKERYQVCDGGMEVVFNCYSTEPDSSLDQLEAFLAASEQRASILEET